MRRKQEAYAVVVALVWVMGMVAGAEPASFVSADREIRVETETDQDGAMPATEFADFSESLCIDTGFGSPLALAKQQSTLGVWEIDVSAEVSADTDYETAEPLPGSGHSHFEAVFELSEAVSYHLFGSVSGYDGTARFSLGGVHSTSATTELEGPGKTTPGSDSFDFIGILEPGTYTLRAQADTLPTLGGSGFARSKFTLRLRPQSWGAWLEFHHLPADADPGSDDDQDTAPLLREYAFRADPGIADVSVATPSFEFDAETRKALMTYPGERGDLEYVAEWSTDLRTWSSAGVTTFDAGLTVFARYTVPPTSDQFAMRLRVAMR